MRTMQERIRTALVVACLISSPAWAHRPVFTSGTHSDASHAVSIPNSEIAWVVYHAFDNPGETFWVTFDGKQGEKVAYSLQIPVLTSLKTYRPVMALIGPGLPDISSNPSINIPANTGGIVYSTDSVQSPAVVKDSLSDTYAWELAKQETVLPESGKYYLAIVAPSDLAGKVAVQIGNRDVFSLLDIFRMQGWGANIRDFYEAGDDQRSSIFMFLFSIGVVLYCLL